MERSVLGGLTGGISSVANWQAITSREKWGRHLCTVLRACCAAQNASFAVATVRPPLLGPLAAHGRAERQWFRP